MTLLFLVAVVAPVVVGIGYILFLRYVVRKEDGK